MLCISLQRSAQFATGRIRPGHDRSFRIYEVTSSTDHDHDHRSLNSLVGFGEPRLMRINPNDFSREPVAFAAVESEWIDNGP
jgi:hypothetical protein